MNHAQRKIRLRVPATTANLGPGFDCLGLALQWYNFVEVTEQTSDEPTLVIDGQEAPEDLPRSAENLVWRAFAHVFHLVATAVPPLTMRVTIGTPIARGLGSSAAAIVGGMAAANFFLGKPLSPDQLVAEMIAMEGHPDNVVACYYGGLTASLVTDSEVYVRKYYPAESLRCVLIVPDYHLSTANARQVLPRRVSMKDAVFNMARIPFVIDKLCTGDVSGLDVIMDDRLHQPHRRKLIAEYDLIESEAMRAGAAAVCLSGSGPTLLAVTERERAAKVADAVKKMLIEIGKAFRVQIVAPDSHGVHCEEGDAAFATKCPAP
ncbi:MAG: homoserine kinase [Candidatus Sumerlaeaceae bacterium]|jgi:homoserine kinase